MAQSLVAGNSDNWLEARVYRRVGMKVFWYGDVRSNKKEIRLLTKYLQDNLGEEIPFGVIVKVKGSNIKDWTQHDRATYIAGLKMLEELDPKLKPSRIDIERLM